jgi:hypothetical protein
MKNFLDLLATNFSIEIEMSLVLEQTGTMQAYINGRQIYNSNIQQPTHLKTSVLLLSPIDIEVHHNGVYVQSLKFDGWEARPTFGQELPNIWKFSTNNLPFYQWKHHATGQGWLLDPQM